MPMWGLIHWTITSHGKTEARLTRCALCCAELRELGKEGSCKGGKKRGDNLHEGIYVDDDMTKWLSSDWL